MTNSYLADLFSDCLCPLSDDTAHPVSTTNFDDLGLDRERLTGQRLPLSKHWQDRNY